MQKSRKNPFLSVLIIGALLALAFGGGVQYDRYRQNRAAAAQGLLAALDTDETLTPLDEAPLEIVLEPGLAEAPPAEQLSEQPLLAVHVKGAVEHPGLYELPQGSRVADALALAVLLEDANTDIINLAAPLCDSSEVVAPFRAKGEETNWEALAISAASALQAPVAANSGASGEANSPASPSSAPAAPSIVNINTAGLAALQTLSGIGPVKAQAIIDYRVQHGPFAKIDDIKKVSGIGPATFDNIKAHITVE